MCQLRLQDDTTGGHLRRDSRRFPRRHRWRFGRLDGVALTTWPFEEGSRDDPLTWPFCVIPDGLNGAKLVSYYKQAAYYEAYSGPESAYYGYRVAASSLHTPRRELFVSTRLISVRHPITDAPYWETMVFAEGSQLNYAGQRFANRHEAAVFHTEVVDEIPLAIAMELGERVYRVEHWPQRLDPASFTCPVCFKTSRHPDDIRYGYCGRCHDWTGAEA